MPRVSFQIAGLFTVAFTLATALQIWFQGWQGNRTANDGVLSLALGDSRRLFANHFFLKADAYFHSGVYPSIFDDRSQFDKEEAHMAGGVSGEEHEHDHDHDHAHAHEEAAAKPVVASDTWIDRFGKHFYPEGHTHLDTHGDQRELLPWLKLSAELDPHEVRTYTVAAFWLRTKMNKVKEAEEFLRDGLRANPGSYEILLELGRIFAENHQELDRARNLLELALTRWRDRESLKVNRDITSLQQIIGALVRLEESQQNYAAELKYLDMLKQISPNPGEVEKRIQEVRALLPAVVPSTK